MYRTLEEIRAKRLEIRELGEQAARIALTYKSPTLDGMPRCGGGNAMDSKLIAKENIVGTLSILYGGTAEVGAIFTVASGYAYLVFNLLCAPCVAAIGAIRREMKSARWTAFALLYQTALAWVTALVVNQVVGLFLGTAHWLWATLAFLALGGLLLLFIYPLLRRKSEREGL